MILTRGRVYAAMLDESVGEKLYLVVSNNQRNRALGSALVARLTTTRKPDYPSIVVLSDAEDFAGSRVLCDDIEDIYEAEVVRDAGALSARAMAAVDDGLRAALSLS